VPEVAFVMSARQDYLLRELAETLRYELRLQAVPATVHQGGFPEPRPSLVYVLLDPFDYVAAEGNQALPADEILRRTIFLSAEDPPSSCDHEKLALLQRAGAVFVLDQRSVLAMHRLRIPARLLRPGYSKSLDRFDAEAPRPIDVMFLGRHSLRRTEYLSRAASVLARFNCLLQISDVEPSQAGSSSFLGESRWGLLAQTKVLISLHRRSDTHFDWRGAVDAIHCGAVVVTEHASGMAPLVPGEHLLVATADSLPYVVEDLLRDEQHLARIRTQAHQRLSTWIPYALPVSILRAAVVELVGELVPADASLGFKRAPSTSAKESVPVGSADEVTGGASPWPRAANIELVHESPAWAARRAPRVTLLNAVSADDDRVGATLDSLAHSRMRDFELVVVGGRCTRDQAESWMFEHPRIAARLVVSEATALGAARNIALDFARARFCLVVDPGQELYPRCLGLLAGTLESNPNMTFAYPIQEVTGAPDDFVDAGGDYLLSFLDWEPARLRRRNHIHAPMLVNTDQLRRLGGFAADPSLSGFEDYDLWCRIADRGWRGQLVPQVLARRTESGCSSTLATVRPSPGAATAALMQRAPRLMSGAFALAE
jgi:hypothetical protein